MIRELINYLKFKKRNIEELSSSSGTVEDTKQEEKEEFEIVLSKCDNYFKLDISDYIKMSSYFEKMDEIDTLGIGDLVGAAVWWNSRMQRVNKGSYYIIIVGNRLYNILIDGDTLKVDERIKREDEITEERYININTAKGDYNFALHHHDKTGDTFLTRFFSKQGPDFGKLELSDDEFLEEIRSVIANLEAIEGIDNIFDVSLLKRVILSDFDDRVNQKTMQYTIEESK